MIFRKKSCKNAGKSCHFFSIKKCDFLNFENGLFAHKNQSICYKPKTPKTLVCIPFEHFAQKNQSTRYNRKKCIFVHFCNTCFRSIPTPVTRSHSAFARKNQSTRYNQTGRYNTRVPKYKKIPQLKLRYSFAEGRTRTGTWGEPRWILSPLRLPISPLRHIVLFFFQTNRFRGSIGISIFINIVTNVASPLRPIRLFAFQ